MLLGISIGLQTMTKNALNINKDFCSSVYELIISLRRILKLEYKIQEDIMIPENQNKDKTTLVPGQNPRKDIQVLPYELDAIVKIG